MACAGAAPCAWTQPPSSASHHSPSRSSSARAASPPRGRSAPPLPGPLAPVALGVQLVYLLAALALVRAPLGTYRSLAYAPLYVAWKAALYGRALLPTRSTAWIRTARLTPA